jgi:hypothetical protein
LRVDRDAALGVCSACEIIVPLWDNAVEIARASGVTLLSAVSAVLAQAGVL